MAKQKTGPKPREYDSPLALAIKRSGKTPEVVAILAGVPVTTMRQHLPGGTDPKLSFCRKVSLFLQQSGLKVTVDSLFPENN